MDTEIQSAVKAADKKSQYDESAKRLIGNKYILAYILINTVNEFKGIEAGTVAQYIEGEPYISEISVEPGLTNAEKKQQGQRIIGFNSENAEINEGLIRFDIVFYVRMKDGLSQMIINVEAQKDAPSGYNILNRAIFYVSRLISSQKERDFINTNYNDIKRVFSIWICMNMNDNGMDHIHLVNDKLMGSCEWEGKLDLLNIVLIGLSDELPVNSGGYELHRLLGTLFSMELSVKEKLNIIENEYDIPQEEIGKEVDVMCNLSEGIWEKGIEKGLHEGKIQSEIKIIMNMYEKDYQLEQIADVTDKSVEEVEFIIEQNRTMPA